MPRLCSICTHPRRREIDDALVEHAASYESIAAQFGLVRSSLLRHLANCVRPMLQQSRTARQLLDAERLASRMRELDAHVDAVLKTAGKAPRLRLLAVDAGRRNVETLARLSLLYTAQQREEQQREQTAAAAARYPPPEWDDQPQTIHTLVRHLIEAGALTITADGEELEPDQQGQHYHEQQQQQQQHDRGNRDNEDDNDDRPALAAAGRP